MKKSFLSMLKKLSIDEKIQQQILDILLNLSNGDKLILLKIIGFVIFLVGLCTDDLCASQVFCIVGYSLSPERVILNNERVILNNGSIHESNTNFWDGF